MGQFTRLSAQDASFLSTESGSMPMVVGGVAVYDAKPLMLADGSLDMKRIEKKVSALLAQAPWMRQRVEYSPVFEHPVLVDCDEVDLGFHISRCALPKPGNQSLLMELAGRLYNQPLDRKRPLWDMHVIEGLQDDRFAILTRTHHALIDGGSGTNLLQLMHTIEPEADATEDSDTSSFDSRRHPEWTASEAPSAETLFVHELAHRIRGAAGLLEDTAKGLLEPRQAATKAVEVASGLLEAVRRPAAASPFNKPNGTGRRVAWFPIPLQDLKFIKNTFGGTINDVVLAIVSGALRSEFSRNGAPVDDIHFRVACPFNSRKGDKKSVSGNHTASFVVDLPIDVADPMDRYRAVIRETRRAKDSHQSDAVQFAIDVADRAAPEIVRTMIDLASGFQNMVVSNMPGPPFPLYFLGCRALEIHPLTLLLENTSLGLTVLSYDGSMDWCLCADWGVIPSLEPLTAAIHEEFEFLKFRAEFEQAAFEAMAAGNDDAEEAAASQAQSEAPAATGDTAAADSSAEDTSWLTRQRNTLEQWEPTH